MKAWPTAGPETPPGNPERRRMSQWAAIGVPCVPFDCMQFYCEPNVLFHKYGSLRELPLSPPCWAAGQWSPLELPQVDPQDRETFYEWQLFGRVQLKLSPTHHWTAVTRRFFLRDLVWKWPPKTSWTNPLAPVHLLTHGLFGGRMVVTKPRAHRHHVRPVFKKIKTHVHKLRSCIWSSHWWFCLHLFQIKETTEEIFLSV